jgi:hypothetical protein
MRTLVLNQSNIVQDGQNNKLVYNFPNSVLFKNSYLAVSSISMYYSWFNITSAFSNNTFSYTWVQGATTTTYQVIIPDGIYEINTLNQFLQFTFIKNGTYLTTTSSGINVYYAEFILNPARYAVQINTYLVPTSFTGFTAPINITTGVALVPPTQTFNPSIVLPASLNSLLGFVVNFTTNQNTNNAFTPPTSPYVSKNTAGTLSYISTSAPNVQPNSSVLISSSGIDNPYAQPTSIIYSITPSVAVGAIINEKPPAFMWNKLIDGTYNQIRLTILGTNLQPLQINDPAMTIVLVIKTTSDRSDSGV